MPRLYSPVGTAEIQSSLTGLSNTKRVRLPSVETLGYSHRVPPGRTTQRCEIHVALQQPLQFLHRIHIPLAPARRKNRLQVMQHPQ
jgi:hypothetical protein